MAVVDDVKHWVRDRMAKEDQYIKHTPNQAVDELQRVLPTLKPEQRAQEIQRVNALATYYHEGRHREPIPDETRERIKGLSKDSERLTRVDQSREVLDRLGGPPSRETIMDALERSQQTKSKAVSSKGVNTPTENKQQSMGMGV